MMRGHPAPSSPELVSLINNARRSNRKWPPDVMPAGSGAEQREDDIRQDI